MKKIGLYLIALSFSFVTYALQVDRVTDIIGQESEITAIDLSNRGLTEIPAEVFNCTNLKELNLSNNGITHLPLDLAKLNHLKKLNLAGNQGISYESFDALLEQADFSLTDLNLNDCALFFLPTKIGTQQDIRTLDLGNNYLKSLPYHIIRLGKMETLNLSNNRIEDISWQVNQWWSLKNLDISDNPTLKKNALLISLSFKAGLNKLVMSHVTDFPKDMELLEVNELELRNSRIQDFPRADGVKPIRKLTLRQCQFKNPQEFVKTLNASIQPQYLSLERMAPAHLPYFLAADVDSVVLQNNQLKDIRPLVDKKELVWLDVRDNPLNREFTYEFSQKRPDVALFVKEPVQENKGVNPPIEKFIQKPTVKTIQSDKAQELSLGKATFKIPENAFVDAAGNPYNGNVELAYTEYFDPVEIMLSGITMASDSADENLMFSSAGMFNITAQDESGNELALDPQKPIEVELFSTTPRSDMNLYSLSDNGNWSYAGKDEVTIV